MIFEHGDGVGVARDQPEVVAVGQLHLMHRRSFLERGIGLIRIIFERRIGGIDIDLVNFHLLTSRVFAHTTEILQQLIA